MERKYLRAGEFGAAAGLSPKALRLYAEQGLLAPAVIDPATGYRHYAPDQLPRARLIGRLRQLGLPLARIGHLAELTPEARELELRGWLRTQRELFDERSALVEALPPAGGDPSLTGAVGLRDVPATKVLCRSRRIDSTGLPDLLDAAERDLRTHLRASGCSGDGTQLVQFQDLVTPDSDGVVEVAVAYDGSVEPVGDLFIRFIAAHTEAYLPVPPEYEDYPRILRAYDAVAAWTDIRPGIVCSGHPYEIYPGTDARFDVAYPVVVH